MFIAAGSGQTHFLSIDLMGVGWGYFKKWQKAKEIEEVEPKKWLRKQKKKQTKQNKKKTKTKLKQTKN